MITNLAFNDNYGNSIVWCFKKYTVTKTVWQVQVTTIRQIDQ